MTRHNFSNKLLPLLLTMLFMIAGAQNLHAHAGHSHGPEEVAPVVADVPPRFYAHSDVVETVLTFPTPGESGDPILYVATKADNAPVTGATVVADVLSGSKAKIEVLEASTSGAYVLRGLGQPETTVSLSLGVSKGDMLEILSMDNVIVDLEQVNEAAVEGTESAVSGLFGLPQYLVYALGAVLAVAAIANILVVLVWLTRLARGGKSRKDGSGRSLVAVMLAGSLLAVANPQLQAHAGEDHSGGNLSSSTSVTSGSVHFVPVETQFQGGIRTTVSLEQRVPVTFKALGRVMVRPDLQAEITPPAEGKLKPPTPEGRVPIAGAEVKKGQVLVVLEQVITASDKVEIATQKSQVEAELNQALQELNLASRNAERADQLKNVISAKEVEETRAAHKIAQDRVLGLRNRLATLNNSLSTNEDSVRDIAITSPINGIIVRSHVTQGEYVTADKLLYEIVNLDDVFVQADVFESDIAAVSTASTATITLEAYPGKQFEGTLHSIGQEVEQDNRTIHTIFAVPNPGHLLRGGMFVNVGIQSGEDLQAIVVPKSALFMQDGMRQVYRKTGPETFEAAPVQVDRFTEHMAVISSGLAAGDRVAVSGLYQIRMSPVVGGGK